jgi:hypothetical protein
LTTYDCYSLTVEEEEVDDDDAAEKIRRRMRKNNNGGVIMGRMALRRNGLNFSTSPLSVESFLKMMNGLQ